MTRVNLVLLGLLVACALSLVTSRHQARKLFVDLEREQSRSRASEIEYGQLQLEQSTWSTPSRVEKVAREQLQDADARAGPRRGGRAAATGEDAR